MNSDTRNDDQIDLDWIYNEADGELGPQSPGFEGSGDKPAATSEVAEMHAERAMWAAERIHRMGDILNALPRRVEYTLRMAFTRRAMPRQLGARDSCYFHGAWTSDAIRAFFVEIGKLWSPKQACEWLVRAESPRTEGNVSSERLEQLKSDAWTQAQHDLLAALAVYADARSDYDALPATKKRRRKFATDRRA